MRTVLALRAILALPLVALGASTQASCGATFCTLMTDRFAQGSGETHAGWSVDMRLEAVTQNRLRRGSSTIDAGQVSGEEAIERRTRNLGLVTALSYGIDADWSVALRIPLLRRDHQHDLIDEQTGLPGPAERWRFTRLGDVQALLRREFRAGGADASSWALFGGLKLPTGSFEVTNADGTPAERALQPGTGTTDLVLGLAGRLPIGLADALIGQANLSQSLRARDEFKPGRRIELSAGWSHAWSNALGSVLQLNWRHRGRDSGAQAEPDNSGSTTLDLSPGVTLGIGPDSTLYAYLQVPLMQRVGGIQLVPRSTLAVGWTSDF